MNFLLKTVMLATLLAAAAQASEPALMQKVKTGILPSGAFYSVYEVGCASGASSAVISLEGRSRWCATEGGDMVCMRRLRDASRLACTSDGLQVAGRAESVAVDDAGDESRLN